jgi:hypothetical protein
MTLSNPGKSVSSRLEGSIVPTKKKLSLSPSIRVRAQEVLAFAKERAKTAADSAELRNSLFATDGKATELFPTERERAAFLRSKEYRQILPLYEQLPDPPLR